MAETAERVVVELLAKTDGYTAAVNGAAATTTSSMSRIEQSASRAEGQIVRSAGAIANAQRNLGRQVADIGAQVAGGQSPFLIIAQQAPQVADALSDTEGKAASVARFFSGPWGAALLAAGSVLGVLLEKSMATGTGVEALVDKLRENAVNAERAAQADRIFAGTQEGLEARIRQTTKALNDQNASLRTNAQLRNVQARQQFAEAERRVAEADASVAAARRAAAQTFTQGGTRGEVGSERAIAAQRDAVANLTRLQRAAQEASANLNRSRVFLAAEQAAADVTASGRISRIYDDRIDAVKRAAIVEANAGKQIGRATLERIAALEREKAAAIDAAGARERVASPGGGRSNVRARAMASAAPDALAPNDFISDVNRSLAENAAQFDRVLASVNDYADRQRIAVREILGREGQDYADPFEGVDVYDRERDARFALADEVKRKQEDDIYALASLYESAFTGGTRGFLDEFKREGLRVIALLLARMAAGQSLSAAFGSASEGSIFQAIGGVFGRASGGYVAPGQTVRVNEHRGGAEYVRMGPQGGTVIPLGQTRAERPNASAVMPPVVIQIASRKGDAFDMEVLSVTGPQMVQVVRQSAPAIVDAAVVKTFSEFRKPGL